MSEPRTEVGKALGAMISGRAGDPLWWDEIVAIEAEARTAALDEVESAVIRLDNEQFRGGRVGTRAVLAAIAALRGGSPNA